jgi:hypothetical protein
VSGATIVEGQRASPRNAGGHPVWTIVFILVCIVSAGRFAVLVGWDIRGWFASLWDTITTISMQYPLPLCRRTSARL